MSQMITCFGVQIFLHPKTRNMLCYNNLAARRYTVFHRSTRVMAAIASTITGVRRAKQVS